MRIHNGRADIFEYAPEHCDSLIVWGRRGLNQFRSSHDKFVERLRSAGCVARSLVDGSEVRVENEPWCSRFAGAPIELTPALGRLRILFFLPNPRGQKELGDAELAMALTDALSAVAAAGAASVAVNSARPLGLGPVTEDNRRLIDARVALTRDVCSRWLHAHPESALEDVHLVSLNDAFTRT